jgi:hypothetical protein
MPRISWNVSPAGSGTIMVVSSTYGTMVQPSGSLDIPYYNTVNFYAAPYSGYRFVGWSGPSTITVTGDYSITAYFEPETPPSDFLVTWDVSPPGGGLVEVYRAGTLVDRSAFGSITVPASTTLTFVARPASGYVFERWSTGETSISTTLTISANAAVTAFFRSAATPAGVIEGLTASPNPARAGETVTLSFTVRNTGTQTTAYTLVGKAEGPCVSQQGQTGITLNPGESRSLSVQFQMHNCTHTQTVELWAGGTRLDSKSVTVQLVSQPPPRSVTVGVSPTTVRPGQSLTVSGIVSEGGSPVRGARVDVTVDGYTATAYTNTLGEYNATITIRQDETRRFLVVTARDAATGASASTTVNVEVGRPVPRIVSWSADKTEAAPGEDVVLTAVLRNDGTGPGDYEAGAVFTPQVLVRELGRVVDRIRATGTLAAGQEVRLTATAVMPDSDLSATLTFLMGGTGDTARLLVARRRPVERYDVEIVTEEATVNFGDLGAVGLLGVFGAVIRAWMPDRLAYTISYLGNGVWRLTSFVANLSSMEGSIASIVDAVSRAGMLPRGFDSVSFARDLASRTNLQVGMRLLGLSSTAMDVYVAVESNLQRAISIVVQEPAAKPVQAVVERVDDAVSAALNAASREVGRPLSPSEAETIRNWIQGTRTVAEEAATTGRIAGVRNALATLASWFASRVSAFLGALGGTLSGLIASVGVSGLAAVAAAVGILVFVTIVLAVTVPRRTFTVKITASGMPANAQLRLSTYLDNVIHVQPTLGLIPSVSVVYPDGRSASIPLPLSQNAVLGPALNGLTVASYTVPAPGGSHSFRAVVEAVGADGRVVARGEKTVNFTVA